MSKPARLTPEAEDELSAATSWYEAQRKGLGLSLLAAVGEAIDGISEQPASCGLVPGVPAHLGVRRKLVRRFPYAVVFVELPDDIQVIALAHGHRRPGYWRSRFPVKGKSPGA